jgi:quercetin dioxygenase-like cupin family protein
LVQHIFPPARRSVVQKTMRLCLVLACGLLVLGCARESTEEATEEQAADTVAGATPLAQDPVVVDSAHYKLEFENEQVRVLRITYGPNEKSVMHDHPAAVAVFLDDMKVQFTLPDGQTVEDEGKAGEAMWGEAGQHLPQNMTDQPFELILVELKGQSPGDD